MRAPRSAQLKDSQRDTAIELALRILVAAPGVDDKARAWQILSQLVKGRSPAQVARLEEQRGLVRS
jgi:hypothetical protein